MHEIIAFIRKHWIIYVLMAIAAIALGFAAAFFIYRVGSTTS